MKLTFEQETEAVKKMAKDIWSYEKSHDSSMKHHFIDAVVTEYVMIDGIDFCSMYDYVMEHQIKDYATYGDIDESVQKLIISGNIGKRPDDYDYSATGIFLKDIFSGNNFYVIKVIQKHKKLENHVITEYHIRKVRKDTTDKEIDIKTILEYGDCRDKGYVVTFVLLPHEDQLKVLDLRGMIYTFTQFKEAFQAIRAIHYEMVNY